VIFAEKRRYQRSPDSDLFCAKKSLSGDLFFKTSVVAVTFSYSLYDRNITVDVKINIRHVANEIMKQAGIEYHF